MKATLNLTFEDGLKVVEAMRDVAIENGWDAEELDECGVIEEYSRVVDAALSAMGFDICIDPIPSVEEDEDEDEDFEDEDDYFDFEEDEDEDEDEADTTYYGLTVKGEFVLRYVEAGHSFGEAIAVADLLFGEGE